MTNQRPPTDSKLHKLRILCGTVKRAHHWRLGVLRSMHPASIKPAVTTAFKFCLNGFWIRAGWDPQTFIKYFDSPFSTKYLTALVPFPW